MFAQMLQEEGLTASYTARLQESRGAGDAEVGRVILTVGIDGARTIAEDMLKKTADLGEGALITMLAQRAVKRFQKRAPDAHVEILDDDEGDA